MRLFAGRQAGINVEAGDARAIADALVTLSENRAAADQMAHRARRHFVEHSPPIAPSRNSATCALASLAHSPKRQRGD